MVVVVDAISCTASMEIIIVPLDRSKKPI